MFDLYNTNANAANRLRPIGGPWSFFSRMRILAGGQILEDIDLYNRSTRCSTTITAEGSRYNDYSEGFGNVWEGFQDPNALNGAVNNGSAVSIIYLPGIPGASYQTVLFKPLSGILNQRKYIPLRFMPITIELSLVDDPLDPIYQILPINRLVRLFRPMPLQMLIHLQHGRSRMCKLSVILFLLTAA